MCYFSACNIGIFKSYFIFCIIKSYVLFLPLEKSFKYYEKYLKFYFYIFLKKKCSKQVCYKENEVRLQKRIKFRL